MKRNEIKALVEKVNNYWIGQNNITGDCNWEKGTYMLGNLAAYDITRNSEFLEYAKSWADENEWRFYKDAELNTTNADSILCGEVYMRLITEYGIKGTDEFMKPTLEYILKDETCDYWWWIDAVFMALPFLNYMGVKFNDERYFEKACRLYLNTRNQRKLYDEEEKLWFRDEDYIPEKLTEANGKKIFWGRGNGWVFSGLARTLELLPENNKFYNLYKKDFEDMAAALKKFQNEDGSYTVSFYDKETYPYHESSSTTLITLGYLIGMRLGLLDNEYSSTAMKGFEWLTDIALDNNGRIGWCQDIAGWPSHNVAAETTKDYVVGTYLLILSELYRTSKD